MTLTFLYKRRLAMLHGRLGVALMAAASVLVVGWSVLIACSTVAGPGCSVAASSYTCNVVKVAVTTDGPFRLDFKGGFFFSDDQGGGTIGSPYSYSFDVAPGTNLITGTTSANNLTIVLSSVASTKGGVVLRGSLMSLTGPGGTASACSVSYSIPSGGARPQQIRLQYTLYTGPDKC
jgi:hypothetical protein